MIILTIRTDRPKAEVGLFEDGKKLEYYTWTAHRQLSETIHTKIEALLKSQGKDWHDIGGIVCFQGPGSFTGLRIGLTVGNSLSANLDVPIAGGKGLRWIKKGTAELKKEPNKRLVMPDYGRSPHITRPKK